MLFYYIFFFFFFFIFAWNTSTRRASRFRHTPPLSSPTPRAQSRKRSRTARTYPSGTESAQTLAAFRFHDFSRFCRCFFPLSFPSPRPRRIAVSPVRFAGVTFCRDENYFRRARRTTRKQATPAVGHRATSHRQSSPRTQLAPVVCPSSRRSRPESNSPRKPRGRRIMFVRKPFFRYVLFAGKKKFYEKTAGTHPWSRVHTTRVN